MSWGACCTVAALLFMFLQQKLGQEEQILADAKGAEQRQFVPSKGPATQQQLSGFTALITGVRRLV